MNLVTIHSATPEETFLIGQRLAPFLKADDVVTLQGGLGAGKTQLTKGIATALGFNGDVTSPTFSLIHEYRGGKFPLFHIDLYRLEKAEEVFRLGLEEIWEMSGVTLVEWPERAPHLLPVRSMQVKLSEAVGGGRWIQLSGWPSELASTFSPSMTSLKSP